jgi:Icc-related predicted phosphoesterase
MKILALGDPHGKFPKNLDSIIRKNKIDLLIIVGEIPNVPFKQKKNETERQYTIRFEKHYIPLLKRLNSLGIPVFALRGNEGWQRKGKDLFRPYNNITHKRIARIKFHGKTFILFDMIWEENSKKAGVWVRRQMKSNNSKEKRLNRWLKENKNCIVISHAPPYGYVDEVKNKRTNFKTRHVGSKILLKAIKRHQPPLVLCGHIHEAKGMAKIEKTEVYNLGCCGNYKIFNI